MTQAVLRALVAAALDRDPTTRAAAADALAGLVLGGKRAREHAEAALVALMEDEDPGVRSSAAGAFLLCAFVGYRVPGPAATVLRKLATQDTSAEVRSAATRSLALAARTPATLKTLCTALNDDDEAVRDAAAKAFEHLRPDEEAVPGLVSALRRISSARSARKALERLGPNASRKLKAGLQPLKKRLAVAVRHPKGRDLELDTEIAQLVGALGPEAAPLLPALLKVWDDLDAPGLNTEIAETGLPGTRVLIRCLERGATTAVRVAAASALAAFVPLHDATSALARAASNPDATVRTAALRALAFSLPIRE